MNVPTSIYVEQGIRVKSWAVVDTLLRSLAACLCVAMAPIGIAHAEEGVFDAWARWVVHRGPWKGPTVRFPDATKRPAGPLLRADSVHEALHVHAPAGTTDAHLQLALGAAEDAIFRLRAAGWPVPGTDGGGGGTPGFDVYLVASEPSASAGLDTRDALALYDGALTFARIGSTLPTHLVAGCITSAITQAVLLASDPAENEALRAATGSLAAWLFQDQLGCLQPIPATQLTPERGLLGASGPGGLFLAMLSEREDGGSGDFVRDMWQFAQQRSDDAARLRASPNLWQAISRALENAQDALDDVVIDFAIARLFAGDNQRGRRPGFAVLESLAADEPVPMRLEAMYAELPRHLYPTPGVRSLGTSYTRVAMDGPGTHEQLHVWLRGELGPRWSLAAVQLDASGNEVARLVAPARRTPKSYLPLILSPATTEVVLVVTHLPATIPDPDVPPPAAHYKLIIDSKAADR